MITRNQWPAHPYGTCMISQHYVYVPIPKCASSWMKHIFFGNVSVNFETQSQDLPHDAEFVVVLRDPVDRWISGMIQYFRGVNLTWSGHYRNLGWDRVLSQVIFDNHTEHQTSFLQKIDHRRTTWFKFGPELRGDFLHWCQDKIVVTGRDRGPMNCSANQPGMRPGSNLCANEIIKDIHTMINSNPGYQQLLREFYREDCKLYDSVPFYRAG